MYFYEKVQILVAKFLLMGNYIFTEEGRQKVISEKLELGVLYIQLYSCDSGMHNAVVSHHHWVKICNFCVFDFHLLACLCHHLFCYCRPGVCYRNPGYRTESKVPL